MIRDITRIRDIAREQSKKHVGAEAEPWLEVLELATELNAATGTHDSTSKKAPKRKRRARG